MTIAQDIVAGAAPVDMRQWPRICVRISYTLQWQPSNGKSVLTLREDDAVPNANAKGIRLAPDDRATISCDPLYGFYAWSAGDGTIVLNPA